MCWLRDGRTMIGDLRSTDQYGNLILENTVERIYVPEKYGDISRGIVLLKGDTIIMIGEIDEQLEAETKLVKAPVDEVVKLQKEIIEEKRNTRKALKKALRDRGIPDDED